MNRFIWCGQIVVAEVRVVEETISRFCRFVIEDSFDRVDAFSDQRFKAAALCLARLSPFRWNGIFNDLGICFSRRFNDTIEFVGVLVFVEEFRLLNLLLRSCRGKVFDVML